MNRIFRSIKARQQNWMKKNFKHTLYGKELSKLKDIHKGESCFVVGNGPSLNADDLQQIYELGIPSFGTNRVFHIFENTDWRPTYYASEDVIIIRDIQDTIPAVQAEKHFIPINLKWYEDINVAGADWFWMNYDDSRGFIDDVSEGITCKGTITITCIQLAAYMGFTEIYLIGVDHNYARVTTSDGRVLENKEVRDYFSDTYDAGIKNELVHNIDAMTKSYLDVETWSRQNNKFRIYNATRGGKLEVFERKDLDAVLDQIRKRANE